MERSKEGERCGGSITIISDPTQESIKSIPSGSERFQFFMSCKKVHKELDPKLPIGYPGRHISQAAVLLLVKAKTAFESFPV